MRGTGRAVCPVILATAAASIGGCVSASLATNTGPSPPGQRWSTAGSQKVHVGEEVQFDFVLTDAWGRFLPPLGVADYCVVKIGGERIETEPDEHGHFRFSYRFDRVRPGEKAKVLATAYAQRGSRDFMRVQGEWLKAESPAAQPDRKVASDALTLTAYQTTIEFGLVRPADDLDLNSGVLRLRKLDGIGASVYIDRPDRPGFTVVGPDPAGYYRVRYQPTGDQVNPTGTTEAEFTVFDLGGRKYTASIVLETP